MYGPVAYQTANFPDNQNRFHNNYISNRTLWKKQK